jgi:hypothetical protein
MPVTRGSSSMLEGEEEEEEDIYPNIYVHEL